MLLSKAELAGFGMAIVVVVIMGIISLAGPFHHINKIQAAGGKTLSDNIVNVASNQNAPWQFSPRNFTVKVGQTVTFRNISSVDHTATALNHSFDSANIAPGGSWVYIPSHAGKFSYYCAYHPFMTGVITVVK